VANNASCDVVVDTQDDITSGEDAQEHQIAAKADQMMDLLKQAGEMQQALQELGIAPVAGDTRLLDSKASNAASSSAADILNSVLSGAAAFGSSQATRASPVEVEDLESHQGDTSDENDQGDTNAVVNRLQALEAEKQRFEGLLRDSQQEHEDLLKKLDDMRSALSRSVTQGDFTAAIDRLTKEVDALKALGGMPKDEQAEADDIERSKRDVAERIEALEREQRQALAANLPTDEQDRIQEALHSYSKSLPEESSMGPTLLLASVGRQLHAAMPVAATGTSLAPPRRWRLPSLPRCRPLGRQAHPVAPQKGAGLKSGRRFAAQFL